MAETKKRQNRAHRRSKKASMAEIMYKLLDEKVPRIYTEVPLVMRSRYSQHIYRSAFDSFSETAYRVFDVMVTAAPEFAEKIGLVIENSIDEAADNLEADLGKARQMAEEAGLNLDSVNSTVVNEVTAKVTTPQAFKYLQLLNQLDELAAIIQSLWMLQKVDNMTRKNLLMGWQKQMVKLAYEARDLCIDTVRRIVDQQRQARKHEEQKRQIREKRLAEQEKIANGAADEDVGDNPVTDKVPTAIAGEA